VNTTLGAAGLFDIAKRKPFRLPHRPDGFADSFGFYGVKPGAFLFLPVVGPTTVRDLIGGLMDRMVLPTAIGVPFNRLAYSAGTGV
ncbi:VacJ family lipoprotein, partial [Escherichia coli]|nr:VacJ family lipoprotein [Escherichia coli]